VTGEWFRCGRKNSGRSMPEVLAVKKRPADVIGTG